MATKTYQRGLTLIEACASLTIVSVLVTAGWPSLKPTLDRQSLNGLAAELASALHHARGEAVSRREGVRVAALVGQGGSCLIAHTGAANSCQCGDSAAPVCEAGSNVVSYHFLAARSGLTVNTNVASLRFDPRLGTATPAGTLRVASAGGAEVHHVVNVVGRVRSCSPNAAVAGFRAC